MVTICCECQKVLKVTTDHMDLVSHDYCDKCAAEFLRKYEADKQEARRA
jgi:hypothetical protein